MAETWDSRIHTFALTVVVRDENGKQVLTRSWTKAASLRLECPNDGHHPPAAAPGGFRFLNAVMGRVLKGVEKDSWVEDCIGNAWRIDALYMCGYKARVEMEVTYKDTGG